MSTEAEVSQANLESRVAALEAAVSRLSSIVEPAFTVANMAAPVATASLKEAGQNQFYGKFFALLDLGEALLKYSAALAFASVTQAGGTQASEVLELFKQPPTLGKLAGGLRNILAEPSNNEWPLEALRETFRRQNGKPTQTARYLLDEFISIRNAERGHGAHQPDGYYEGLYLKNYLIVKDCLNVSKHIQLPLIYVNAVNHEKGQYAYTVTLLMGGSPIRMPEPIVTPQIVRSGSTCLWDRGVRLLPLDNFVMFRYCDTCAVEHAFFAEQITGDNVSLHSYTGNHRMVVRRI